MATPERDIYIITDPDGTIFGAVEDIDIARKFWTEMGWTYKLTDLYSREKALEILGQE